MTPADPPAPEKYLAIARSYPGLVLTGAYLGVSGVGMLSSWTFYRRFGINIFDFTQVSDFFLVSLRQPLAALAILAAIPAVWFVLKSDTFLERRFSWYKHVYGPKALRRLSRSPAAWVLYVVLYAYAFSLVSSGYLAGQVRAGSVATVEAQLLGGQYLGRDGTRPFRASLLGTTAAFVFLYDQGSGDVTIVPVENLASLSVR